MKNFPALILILPVWLLCSMTAFPQEPARIGIEGQRSWIIPHSAELVPISLSRPHGVQLSWEYLPFEKAAWENCNCFYYWGGNMGITDFNNPEVLGKAYYLSGFFEPIIWRNADWQLSLRGAMGITHLTRVFDSDTNPQNTFFSSPLSFLLSVNPRLNYQMGSDWSIHAGIHYNHISNGGQRQPNRGMNFPGIGVGLSHWLMDIQFPVFEKPAFISSFSLILEGYATYKDDPVGAGRLPAFGISADLTRSVSRINHLGIGIESTWDFSIRADGERTYWIPAPSVSHHLTFGKIDFSQRMAVYLSKPEGYQDGRRFYQRYSLSYQFENGFRLGADLKVHGHVAENIGLRTGWRF
ncbi:Lipid A 3-O-deacylase (PagL) [Cyclobacterium lianum]|uniref:Lipid A 3-O-deacylase (PagL) n=1 Tax=Cyclobacterium lianum TaxID=388280 RepID=A0A1M7L372_9BACT|nr:acyloxyacyl hydrolase [Cyclobacterium lianum]SHM72165.1 Lipid A 3-O-deacylase (PagL) [Cyclobacterium lianum]